MYNILIKSVYAANDVVGTISVPGGVPSDFAQTGTFVSAIVKLLMIVGGLFTFWQFLSGGFLFISSGGDKGKVTEAQQKIQMSVTGLVVMTASFIIIAIVSMILFGNPMEILNPKITTINVG